MNAELADSTSRRLGDEGGRPPGGSKPAAPGVRGTGARITPLRRASYILRRWLAFAYFGLAGLAISWVVLPVQSAWLRLWGGGAPLDLRAQRAIGGASRGLVRIGERIGIIRVRWQGLDRLHGHRELIVANHPSLIDTPILLSQLSQLDLLVSPDWSESFFFRGASSAADYIGVSQPAQVLREATRRIRAGRRMAIFPEGSRTPEEGLRPFRRGAAHIALSAGVGILPVVIRVTPRTLMKGQAWHHVPERTPTWVVEVGEPIDPADHLDGTESRPVASRRLTAVLQAYFQQRWSSQDGQDG